MSIFDKFFGKKSQKKQAGSLPQESPRPSFGKDQPTPASSNLCRAAPPVLPDGVVVVKWGEKILADPELLVAREAMFQAVLSGATDRLIVDLYDTQYISSAALGLLENVRRECANRGVTMAIVGVKGELCDVFQIMKLDLVYSIFDTLAEAIAERG